MIEQMFIGIAWIWGVKAIFTEPFIFYKQGNWMENKLPKWFCKPLFRCSVCMASFWGTIFYFGYGNHLILGWIVFCISIAGINFLIIEFLYPEDEFVETINNGKE